MSPDAAKKMRDDEKQVRSTKGYAGFAVHNELRDLYSQIDPDRAMQECDIILSNEPMQDYILSILSDWTLANDADKAIVNLSAVAANNPRYPAVQAAALIESGQLAWSLGRGAQAVEFYSQARQISERNQSLRQYKEMAELALRQCAGAQPGGSSASGGAPSTSEGSRTVPNTIADARIFPADALVWPNATSHANSDAWLVANHDRIEQLRPGVLVINFANGVSTGQIAQRVNSLIACLREASRYHGYADGNARPFLDYHVFKFVDLADSHEKKTGTDGNCRLFPWRPKGSPGSSFRYPALFEDAFTRLYNVSDGRNRDCLMSLSDLVNGGFVNEVWLVAYQGDHGAPFESVELKQAYDNNLRPIPANFVQAGNGGDPEQPRIGRSLRILFINVERGPGCAMESLGHSFERMASDGAIPYLVPYFKDFAGFNLDTKYGMPFDSLYGRDGNDLNYPAPTTIAFNYKGRPYSFANYIPVGGNVHFTVNGRHDYDLDNPQPVLSSIEHYRMHDGANGSDRLTMFTPAAYARYRDLACDCMGPWLVYWRQNWPNFHSPSVDDQGWRMKNWWPFLFY